MTYQAKAVNFNGGQFITIPSLACQNGPLFTMSGFFKLYPNPNFLYFFVHDPDGDEVNWLRYNTADFVHPGYTGEFASEWQPNTIPKNVWVSVLLTVDTNYPAGQRKFFLYVNDALVSVGQYADTPMPFDMIFNGVEFVMPHSRNGARFVGDASDFRIWHNVFIGDDNSIPFATRRLFSDVNNKPVDPLFAIAALGCPTVMFSGDKNSFALNQGSAGSSSLTGVLTDASTSPSD